MSSHPQMMSEHHQVDQDQDRSCHGRLTFMTTMQVAHLADPIAMELPKGGAIVPYSLRFLGLRLRLAFTKRRFDQVEAIYRSHVDDEYEQARPATLLTVFEASFSSLRDQISEIEQGQEIIKKKILPRVRAQCDSHRCFLVFLQGFREEEDSDTSTAIQAKCHLSMLSIGEETTTAIKLLIAEFAGIPTRGTLHDLRSLAMMLDKHEIVDELGRRY